MGQLHLRGAGQHMTNLTPVDQVVALKQRHAWEILKGRGDQIILPVGLANAGVGIKAGDDRILITHHLFLTQHQS